MDKYKVVLAFIMTYRRPLTLICLLTTRSNDPSDPSGTLYDD